MSRFVFSIATGLFVLMGAIHVPHVSAQAETVTITSGGNVGIGTTLPAYRLDVNGSINADSLLIGGVAVGTGGSSLWSTSGAKIFYDLGHVGIGTTSPQVPLDVRGDVVLADGDFVVDATQLNDGTDFFGLKFGALGSGEFIGSKRTVGGNRWGLDFYTEHKSRVSITLGGDVGIGTTAPRGVFDVATDRDIYLANDPNLGTPQSIFLPGHIYIAPFSGEDVSYLQARRLDNSGSTALQVRTYDDGTLVEAMRVTSNGNVGIGTASPDQLLSVAGDASKVGGGSWSTFSDARLKTDVHPFTDGLAVAREIRPVTFRYNGTLGYPTDRTYVGVIAQEVQPVAPYTVDIVSAKLDPEDDEETDILRYDSSSLLYIAINAINELDARVQEMDSLRAENRALMARLARLESTVRTLAQASAPAPRNR